MELNIAAVCGLCITAAVLCKIMEKYNREYALFLSAAVCAGIVVAAAVCFTPVLSQIESFFSRSGLDGGLIQTLFKALGICYITQFAAELCRDCGENAMAVQAETAGKIALILLALPLFSMMLELVGTFTGL